MGDNNVWVNLLQDLLYVIIIAVIPVITKFVTSYLDAKKKEIEVSKENLEFKNTLLYAVQIVHDAVDTVSQTYTYSLKKEGKFTKEAQEEAFNMALESVKRVLSDEMKRMIATTEDDLNTWITLQIESYINNKAIDTSIKETQAGTPSATIELKVGDNQSPSKSNNSNKKNDVKVNINRSK